MRRFLTILTILLVAEITCAQSAMEKYLAFKQAAMQEYTDFKTQANEDYASFLKSAWEYYRQAPAIPHPEEQVVPPVVYEEPTVTPEPKPLPYEEVVTVPDDTPQPQPVSPVKENNRSVATFALDFYGTHLLFRCPNKVQISLDKVTWEGLAQAWQTLAGGEYDDLLYDCLTHRENYHLCDWAYLEMLQRVSQTLFGGINEATLMQAFLYANSGYQMRLAATDTRVYLLIGSQYIFYDRSYFKIDDMYFFALEEVPDQIAICGGSFEGEKPFSLQISHEQGLTNRLSEQITRRSGKVSAQCHVNTNQLSFYSSYPTGYCGSNFGTRWAVYANAPLDESVRGELYPALREAIRGADEAEALNILLNWVQRAFEYKLDDEVWGQDRAFFPSETLYYPYCDCEDRSILFSRIVRDLLGLDVVLLYYPGHLATAVNLHQDIKGDYLTIEGRRYTICDPTYIGAPVGATMPGMDNRSAKVIRL